MRGWSFSAGHYFGVEVRIHAFFLLLLAAAVGAGTIYGIGAGRVISLWLLLLFAVVVREITRSIAAAWLRLDLRAILLLPTGGLMTFATLDASDRASQPNVQRRLALVGPVTSVGMGLLLAGLILSAAPGVKLLDTPWISPAHLLRAAVWLNVLLGLVNLLPAPPLDGARVFQLSKVEGAPGGVDRRVVERGARLGGVRVWGAGGGLGQWFAIALIIAGLVLSNMWLTFIGAFVLIGAHMQNQELTIQSDVESVRMRDVMLTQFSTLSASDTLEDALQRAVHTLQDVFPVVRGGALVGSVSRQNILEALATQGNSYVQGVMTRSFQTAQPDDSLVKTLRRIVGDQGAQLVPVMDGDRIVGIVTPQNLSHSMGLLNQSRRMRRSED